MTGSLLDTHLWIWSVAGSPKLPAGLRRLIDRDPARCWLSPVSVWELLLLVEQGRLRLGMPLGEWVSSARHALPAREAPLTEEVVLRTSRIQLPHRDPADPLLAATALGAGLTLLTVDERLMALGWLPTSRR